MASGALIVAWGSFSDWGVYHGWLMAFDPATLNLLAVFNPTPQYQAVDAADGPADHGGGGAFWQGGAAPPVDASGNIYINAQMVVSMPTRVVLRDTMLKLHFTEAVFRFWTSSAGECGLHRSSRGGLCRVALLPTTSPPEQLRRSYSKEGRLFVVNTAWATSTPPGTPDSRNSWWVKTSVQCNYRRRCRVLLRIYYM